MSGGRGDPDSGRSAPSRPRAGMAENYRVCSIAGCGKPGHKDGDRRICELNCPSGIALDPSDAVWITDRQNHCIRRLPGREDKSDLGREDWITTAAGQAKRPGPNDYNRSPGLRCLSCLVNTI